MKSWSRRLYLVIGIILVLILSACGSSSNNGMRSPTGYRAW